MTYTYKLARRPAVSRDFAMLAGLLLLLAACAGKTPMPPASPGESPLVRARAFVLSPRTVTTEINRAIKFRGMLRDVRSKYAGTYVTWTATGGRIGADGAFSSATPGTFKVVGRGRGGKHTDTSTVIVVPRQPTLVRIVVSPDPTSVLMGTRKSFTGTGYLRDSITAPVGVTWTATGGTIDASVTLNSSPVVAVRLIVAPSSASVATGTTKQFSGTAKMSDSSVTSPVVTWSATGGTIMSTGLYTAGITPGTYSVRAVSGSLSASASVSITGTAPSPQPAPTTGSLSFGSYECTGSNIGPFTLCLRSAGHWSAGEMKAVETAGGKFILGQGGYSKFKDASGNYSPTMYYNWVQSLRPYVSAWQPYLTDGTLIGVQVIDDRGATNWGGVAITNAQTDEMAKWWKEIMPGLPTLVRDGRASGISGYSWQYLDGAIMQYANYLGDITAWRDGILNAAQTTKLSLVLSLNVLDGGNGSSGWQGGKSTKWNMSPTELRTYGQVLAAAPGICGLVSWKTDPTYQARTGVTEALKYIAGLAAQHPATSCNRR